MRRLIKHGALVDDAYVVVREAGSLADLPRGVPVIVPLHLWQVEHEALIARSGVGVWLAPDADPAVLADAVATLPVIAVDFPAFADGRGYSIARLLRERYAFAGELRAIGDIQRDQLAYLLQSGFDAFALREDRDVAEALAGLADFSDGYQVTTLRTPWFRRRAAAADAAREGSGA
jgi:uncharacterized protein (DUF934 family)